MASPHKRPIPGYWSAAAWNSTRISRKVLEASGLRKYEFRPPNILSIDQQGFDRNAESTVAVAPVGLSIRNEKPAPLSEKSAAFSHNGLSSGLVGRPVELYSASASRDFAQAISHRKLCSGVFQHASPDRFFQQTFSSSCRQVDVSIQESLHLPFRSNRSTVVSCSCGVAFETVGR